MSDKPSRSGDAPRAKVQMADIARMAGVSESTVSRALADNPLVAERTRAYVKQLAARAGYQVDPVARSLRSRRSNTICVAVPLMHAFEQPLSDPFMMTMLALLAEELTGNGYSMLLSKVDRHQDGWVERLARSSRADGLVMLGQSSEHEAMNAAAREGWPMVVWGSRMPGQAYVSVGSDNRRGGELATAHLIEAGRRRIAFLGDEQLPEVAPRFAGYRAMLEQHGLVFDPRLHARSHFVSEDAYRLTRAMLKKADPPDGVFAASDLIALGAIRALAEAGLRVPQDVSLVGFDDLPLASYSQPPLTTVRQDLTLAARHMVDRLLALVDGGTADSLEMPVQLVVRESA
ncbi:MULTISPECIES: LacI family DNA-binding transcriptional regulator [Pseudoxanthomonas]|uniref:DNA-binding LacI/PurR family transcriptional regulator n=1 Tax=Pseudoxanthomonas winnipegensis TaxID=2480810 RepID=A0AAW8GF07_9GAMM|nr:MULTISPECIES: LacI family DNA-binding transcriptional regulator [Pseudoxanthomonas]MDQ1121060.1 DNA-binding LacI/PurR family transcriptional regulator [Pseudoxanthomonas winnipegensis]MDQ1134290.1 DNA-binding LacI/PurR family transcriptional regulator [Pseudoxanthomonas winnipegensis]MDR6139477.1 DNA-binding LacI/PurR family transcriptional regulator [Pseudoxanthomonas sp. SORGH_AS_0997]